MSETMPHWLTKQAYLSPDRLAIETESGEMISFLQLKRKSQSFAKKLSQMGLKAGVHVGVLSNNHPEMIIIIHALSYLGAVAVLLNSRLTAQELSFQIKDSETSIVITSDHLPMNTMKMPLPVQLWSYSEVLSLQEKDVNLQSQIDLKDVFTIIYTSGTTGSPKGVVHTYGNHWWSAVSSALNLGLHSNDKWLAGLPVFHVGGLSIFIKSVIYGMPVFLLEKFDAKLMNQAIINKGVTIVSVVTIMLKQLLNNLDDGNVTYPETFRCMLLGGGPAPLTLLEKAREYHIPVFQSYGLTETSSQMVTIGPDDALNRLGSSGKPLFPGQLKIHQPGLDSIGEIYVKGPMVTKGYYRAIEENKNLFNNGWLSTGDLGYLDEAGYLYVVDRRTDLIISGGENIYPSEIENVLIKMNGIKDVGIIGQKDSEWGQVPVAFIVKADQYISSEDVLQYANNYLANYKIPKKIYFMDRLPRNASRKLMKHELKKLLK